MSKVRVCFLGTPDFAVTSLKKLIEDEHFEIVGVVTQPDRPAGRKMLLTPSPVKTLAQAHGLRVISPEKINQDLILQEIEKWGAEVAVVVAFGQILSQKFLDMFPLGAVNVHGSLLPLWRGAAPIQRSIQAGDTVSGVALQKIVRELDAGDIIGVRKVEMTPDLTAKELYETLAQLGADLLSVELMDYVRGNLAPVPQDHSKATFAKKIDKSEAELKWTEPGRDLNNKVRAFNMGPGTWVPFQGKKLKIHRTRFQDQKSAGPGVIQKITDGSLFVGTGSGVLEIFEVQPESRNRMPVKDFLKAHQLKEGDQFV
ncbi:MAG: methionyl-tRNA formyltransferase [Oligoflexia bacterium]|nr:MAG: methionyl-tRNA formyltransferase [Oligoflexia bacterium]